MYFLIILKLSFTYFISKIVMMQIKSPIISSMWCLLAMVWGIFSIHFEKIKKWKSLTEEFDPETHNIRLSLWLFTLNASVYICTQYWHLLSVVEFTCLCYSQPQGRTLVLLPYILLSYQIHTNTWKAPLKIVLQVPHFSFVSFSTDIISDMSSR